VHKLDPQPVDSGAWRGQRLLHAFDAEDFSPDIPQRIVITDQSGALLQLAERHFKVPHAEYTCLDIRNPFPFDANSFDFILATMVFNEVSSDTLQSALNECRRVVRPTDRL